MKQYTDTDKLITINYQQFLLYSESNDLQKINDLVGYEMQCFFTSWNSPKCHSRMNSLSGRILKKSNNRILDL